MKSNEILQEGINNLNSGNLLQARKCFNKILKKRIDANALALLALCDLQENKLQDGVEKLTKSLTVQPNNEIALNNIDRAKLNLSIHLINANNLIHAKQILQSLIDSKTVIPEAYFNMGYLLYQDLRYFDAIKMFDQCLSLNGNPLITLNQKGLALFKLQKINLAEECFLECLKIDSKNQDASINLANLYFQKKMYIQAEELYSKVISEPKNHFYLGKILEIKSIIFDYKRFNEDRKTLIHNIKHKNIFYDPYIVLTITDDLGVIQKNNKAYSKDIKRLQCNLIKTSSSKSKDKIRVGYISSDFRSHAVGSILKDIFKNHDKSIFDIYGYSLYSDETDNLYSELANNFDHFYKFDDIDSTSLINQIIEHDLDIIIDLNGHTKGSRTEIFKNRLATYQLTYLGFHATMGMEDVYDFILADDFVIDDDQSKFYDEKILKIPNLYLPLNIPQTRSNKYKRVDFGLPDKKFIYCCFNNPKKINPNVFKAWMEILKKTSNSVLFLYNPNVDAKKNMHKYAKELDVDIKRIIFADWIDNQDEYLGRFSVCDLFLDTFPYSAGATARDCISQKLPLLTLKSESFVGRMSSSILNTLKQTHLIATNLEDYINIAVKASKDSSFTQYKKIGVHKSIDFMQHFEKTLISIIR